MLPSELKAEQFAAYRQEAKALASEHVGTFRELPLSFLPGVLRELIEYDYKFPAERRALVRPSLDNPPTRCLPSRGHELR